MTRSYIIIGDGVAGATAAETLREKDEEAEIRVFTDEEEPLYNRIMLKSYMKGDLPGTKFTRVHDEDWYEERDIELFLETQIVDIDREEQIVKTAAGEKYNYDKLLVATGGSPRQLSFDENYGNVHYMWTMENAEEIKKSAEEADRAVVIGGGLLGIDLAMAYAENNCETFYLIRERNWWSRGLDREGAEIIHRKMEQKGVKVLTETEAEDFVPVNGEFEVVKLKSGEKLEDVDAAAVAIGQKPNSEIVDVEKNEVGMIKTDQFLQTSDENIYAAGNMVEYYSPVFEKRTVKGSWDHSEAMGETAALNMIGEQEKFDYVNTYGVGHFDTQFLAIGDWSGEAVSKNYEEEGHYRRLFFDGDRLVGAVLIGYTRGQEELRKKIREKEKVEDRKELF